MFEQELAACGLSVRRRFEWSRLEEELLEAVYEALLVEPAVPEAPVAWSQERATKVSSANAGVAEEALAA
jgi:hypothetical protein